MWINMQIKNVIFTAIFTAAICFLLGFLVAANLGDRVLQHERGRADEYLNALNRSQEHINGIEDQLHQQRTELAAALRESELLRTERAELRKSLHGIREQAKEIGTIESGDYDRIAKLEAIIGRIIDIATAGAAKSGGQN